MLAIALAAIWAGLWVRASRRDPSWSPKRDVIILAITAAVTIFIALPISPTHHEAGRSVGGEVALWATFWLVLAGVIRLLAMLLDRLTRRSTSV